MFPGQVWRKWGPQIAAGGTLRVCLLCPNPAVGMGETKPGEISIFWLFSGSIPDIFQLHPFSPGSSCWRCSPSQRLGQQRPALGQAGLYPAGLGFTQPVWALPGRAELNLDRLAPQVL